MKIKKKKEEKKKTNAEKIALFKFTSKQILYMYYDKILIPP